MKQPHHLLALKNDFKSKSTDCHAKQFTSCRAALRAEIIGN